MPCLDDNLISAFADGALDERELAHVRGHLELCATFRAVAIAAMKPEEGAFLAIPPLGRGGSVGRYTLLECAGIGGMGEARPGKPRSTPAAGKVPSAQRTT